MTNGQENRPFLTVTRRVLSVGWKLAVVAAVGALILYRVRFAPVTVESHVAATGPVAAEVMGAGTLEARVSATIGPRISGLITRVLTGRPVKAGQSLATLYDGDLRQQVKMAEAEVAAAKAGVDRAAAELARAEANARQGRSSYERLAGLVETRAVPGHARPEPPADRRAHRHRGSRRLRPRPAPGRRPPLPPAAPGLRVPRGQPAPVPDRHGERAPGPIPRSWPCARRSWPFRSAPARGAPTPRYPGQAARPAREPPLGCRSSWSLSPSRARSTCCSPARRANSSSPLPPCSSSAASGWRPARAPGAC